MVLYFAYGINVNVEFIFSLLGEEQVVVYGKAILKGYRLSLCAGDGIKRWLGLTADNNSYVMGRLYGITEPSLKILDDYEDVPFVYERRILPVEFENGLVNAVVYLNKDEVNKGRVDRDYAKKVLEGLWDFSRDWRNYVCSLFDSCSF